MQLLIRAATHPALLRKEGKLFMLYDFYFFNYSNQFN